jgi:hypothetical protein
MNRDITAPMNISTCWNNQHEERTEVLLGPPNVRNLPVESDYMVPYQDRKARERQILESAITTTIQLRLENLQRTFVRYLRTHMSQLFDTTANHEGLTCLSDPCLHLVLSSSPQEGEIIRLV